MSYGLAELVAATAMLYLLLLAGSAAAQRTLTGAVVIGIAAASTVLAFAAPPAYGWVGNVGAGFAELLSKMRWVSVVGAPISAPTAAELTDPVSSAAVVALAVVPFVWSGVAYLAGRLKVLDRIRASDVDRRLAAALVGYVGVGLIVGNVAVQAVRAPSAVRRSGEWRQLDSVGDLSFRSMTLKVVDEADGLSPALAMYYVPGRRTEIVGRDVSPRDLSFEGVSKEQPLFIQDFGCVGVGHEDVVSVPQVGCVLLAPPGLTLGKTYSFNQTYLFLSFDRMTAREPGGRWNTRPTLNLNVSADPQRAPLDKNIFVNLQVNPFLDKGAAPLKLLVRWGAGRSGETIVADRKWFSLPVGSGDWKGNRVWALPIAIDFPDNKTILFHDIALTETPKGEVVQGPSG